MRSNGARVAIALAAMAAVVVLFVLLSADDDGGSPSLPATEEQQQRQQQQRQGSTVTGGEGDERERTTDRERAAQRVTIRVRNAKPVGGIERLEYAKGERVRFVVESDVSDEVHVHGYDRTNFVNAGGTASFDFVAKLEGVFEIELESRHVQIAELRVKPS